MLMILPLLLTVLCVVRVLQGGLARLFEPMLGWAARRYQAKVAIELKKYGLRYEDLLDPWENLVGDFS